MVTTGRCSSYEYSRRIDVDCDTRCEMATLAILESVKLCRLHDRHSDVRFLAIGEHIPSQIIEFPTSEPMHVEVYGKIISPWIGRTYDADKCIINDLRYDIYSIDDETKEVAYEYNTIR